MRSKGGSLLSTESISHVKAFLPLTSLAPLLGHR